MSDSCLVKQFEHYTPLTEQEIELLEALEQDTQTVGGDHLIRRAGDRAQHFFTLKSGWAFSDRELLDGDRQVLDIFLPGQVMGLSEISFTRALSNLRTLTEARLCPFPKTRLTDVFRQAPRLCDLFFLIMAREQSMQTERIVNLGRRSAVQKLAHFLVELHVRLERTNGSGSDGFRLPMTQALIGDALGMTAVHVSRSFSRIKQNGLVRLENGRFTILDMHALKEVAEFNPIYLTEDQDWVRTP